jgi:large subunit ribosomal protein L22
MEAIAKAKYLRGSAQKARLVIDMIRGKNVNDALAILKFTNKRATHGIEKCLWSAISNAKFLAAEGNIVVDEDELWVKECFVDRGPTKHRRRVRPAPQGRAYREQRHYCHVTITVSSDERDESEDLPVRIVPSAKAKRGGAAAAPRVKATATKRAETETEEVKAEEEAAETSTEETKSEE